MSGGQWDYADNQLKNDIFGYDYENKNPLEDREISNLVYDVFTLLHDFDWYKSGDTGEENYLAAKDKFKKKWLRNKNYKAEVLQKIIDDGISDLRKDLMEMIK